jgi:hypothetical protein
VAETSREGEDPFAAVREYYRPARQREERHRVGARVRRVAEDPRIATKLETRRHRMRRRLTLVFLPPSSIVNQPRLSIDSTAGSLTPDRASAGTYPAPSSTSETHYDRPFDNDSNDPDGPRSRSRSPEPPSHHFNTFLGKIPLTHVQALSVGACPSLSPIVPARRTRDGQLVRTQPSAAAGGIPFPFRSILHTTHLLLPIINMIFVSQHYCQRPLSWQEEEDRRRLENTQ